MQPCYYSIREGDKAASLSLSLSSFPSLLSSSSPVESDGDGKSEQQVDSAKRYPDHRAQFLKKED